MRFPRHVKIFRGQLDAAPLAGVFFLLLIFLLLASLVYTPGVPVQLTSHRGIELPWSKNLANAAGPTLVVAVNVSGHLFFENQIIARDKLKSRLTKAVKQARSPLTLVILADKTVEYGVIIGLAELAEEAGVNKLLYQVRPTNSKTSQ